MFRAPFIFAAASAAVLMLSPMAFAQQPSESASADQAKAMLLKAVTAVKADKTKALDMFNKGEGGFLDRDIFPFCFNLSDGINVATQTKQALGKDIRTFKDATGNAFGLELYAATEKPEGQITEVSYKFARPGPDTTPVPKVSFVTKVSDLGCAVGYYK
jgi:Single Cache domain 2